jgi:hypothetical protein
MLEGQWDWCTSIRAGASSCHTAGFASCWLGGIVMFSKLRCATKIWVYARLIPTLKCTILMQMPIIINSIMVGIEIGWSMRKPPLVSALSAEW